MATNNATPSPRVLVVEDDPSISGMLVEVLSESYQVDAAGSAEDALWIALRQPFDVMVVDRRLTGKDGVSFIAAIRKAHITTPVLMLTALGSVDDRVSGLDAGANDYLVKPFDFEELLARLRALRRGFAAQSERHPLGEWTYTPDTMSIYSPIGIRVTLTSTENALLRLLADSPDHTFSREEILSAVFSSGDGLGTVDTYVHYVRKKTTKDMIETVRSLGYRLGNPA